MLMRYSLIMQLRLSGFYDALDLCSLTCISVLALWSICILQRLGKEINCIRNSRSTSIIVELDDRRTKSL